MTVPSIDTSAMPNADTCTRAPTTPVADVERAREQYRLGGTRRVGEADEGRRPLRHRRQPHLAGSAPLREGAERVGDAHLDHVRSIIRERRERPGPEDILVTLELHDVRAVQTHLRGGLGPAGRRVIDDPRQPRPIRRDERRIAAVLCGD